MIAFKGFNNKLQATMGNGIFTYEIGKTYEESKAQCAKTGFHCVEEPLEVLSWYSYQGSRYCVVEAEGDIHEDGRDRISCSRITLVKEISRIQLAMYECLWIKKHPQRRYSNHICKDEGEAAGEFVIVRGKNPRAKGKKGATLFLLKEYARSAEIKEIGVYEVDGLQIKENRYYNITGNEVKKDAYKGKTKAVKKP